MNTNKMKKISILSILLIAIVSALWFANRKTIPQRRVANTLAEEENLTPGQKEKWAVVSQFNIRLTNESIQIDMPHAMDLCAENSNIEIHFRATQVAYAGEKPRIIKALSCSQIMIQQQQFIEIYFKDLASLHQTHENPQLNLRSHTLYSDEPLPTQWMLSDIKILGAHGFEINEFEIQKALGQEFLFNLTDSN